MTSDRRVPRYPTPAACHHGLTGEEAIWCLQCESDATARGYRVFHLGSRGGGGAPCLGVPSTPAETAPAVTIPGLGGPGSPVRDSPGPTPSRSAVGGGHARPEPNSAAGNVAEPQLDPGPDRVGHPALHFLAPPAPAAPEVDLADFDGLLTDFARALNRSVEESLRAALGVGRLPDKAVATYVCEANDARERVLSAVRSLVERARREIQKKRRYEIFAKTDRNAALRDVTYWKERASIAEEELRIERARALTPSVPGAADEEPATKEE